MVTGGKHPSNPPQSDANNTETTVATSNQVAKSKLMTFFRILEFFNVVSYSGEA